MVLGFGTSVKGRETLVISSASLAESKTYVWGYPDDVIGLRSSLEGCSYNIFS